MKTPDWAEVEAFCRVDGWKQVPLGRSTDHRYYRLTLDDGTALETRVSHSSKKAISPGRWKAVLHDQLQVSEADFWNALRNKQPARRPSQPPGESEIEQVPLWAADVLSSRLRLAPAEIAQLGRERAIELAHAEWSKPSG